MKQTIYGQIVDAQRTIENALNHKEIQKGLSAFRYARKKLLEGKALCEQTHMLHMSKFDKYGSQYQTSNTLKEEVALVKMQYKRHLQIARLAFEDNRGVQEKLKLKGKRKENLDGWLEQATAFYYYIDGVMEDITRYGADQEELIQTKVMVEALSATKQQQLQTRGEAQHATQQRNIALKQLNNWMKKFRQTARIALQEEPQLLEILGIKVPSQKV